MQEEEVYVAVDGYGLEHLQVASRQPGQPEQRQPVGKVEQPRLVRQPGRRRLEPLGRADAWFCVPELPGLAIYHLEKLAGALGVAALRYEWDGGQRLESDPWLDA